MKKPSRRAVVRTGVWAVPVVGTAAAAPAFAGTTTPPVDIESTGSGCKLVGHSTHGAETVYGYRMVVTFDNNTTSSQVVALIDLTIGGQVVTGFPTGNQVTLQPGANPQVFMVTSSGSSHRTATITYQYSGNIHTKTVTFPEVNARQCSPRDAGPMGPASACA